MPVFQEDFLKRRATAYSLDRAEVQAGSQDRSSDDCSVDERSSNHGSSEDRCAAALDLVAEVLRSDFSGSRSPGRVRIRVRGESMMPAIWPGDLVEIEACAVGQLKRRDIVLARRDGRLFLHRLLSTSANGFVLRGDSVPRPDPPFAVSALLGRLSVTADSLTARPFGMKIAPGLARVIGLVLCHWILARRVSLKLHSRFASRSDLFGGCGANPASYSPRPT